MKAKIVFLFKSQYGDYLDGETGVVDGYVSGGDGTPQAVVVRDRNSQFVLAPLTHLKKLYWINENENNPNRHWCAYDYLWFNYTTSRFDSKFYF